MNRQQIALKLVLDQIGRPLSLDTFQERLILQKSVYLCQKAGLSLGYRFRWYLRGPYSPELTADAFTLLSPGGPELEMQGWTLDPQSAAKLDKIKRFFATIAPSRPSEFAKGLELFASVHFVIAYNQGQADDPQGIEKTLTKAGKSFTLQEIKNATGELIKNGFLPQAKACC